MGNGWGSLRRDTKGSRWIHVSDKVAAVLNTSSIRYAKVDGEPVNARAES
jgi:hypothetical protein